jgi:hypothetical protein
MVLYYIVREWTYSFEPWRTVRIPYSTGILISGDGVRIPTTRHRTMHTVPLFER